MVLAMSEKTGSGGSFVVKPVGVIILDTVQLFTHEVTEPIEFTTAVRVGNPSLNCIPSSCCAQ